MYTMNTLKSFSTILVAVIFVLASCKKNTIAVNPTNSTINNNPPGAFTITISDYSSDTAKINWTRAVDPDNDSVTYKIYLNDTLKAQDFKELNYTFRNLAELKSYDVKVVAVDSKLKETPSSMNFTTNMPSNDLRKAFRLPRYITDQVHKVDSRKKPCSVVKFIFVFTFLCIDRFIEDHLSG